MREPSPESEGDGNDLDWLVAEGRSGRFFWALTHHVWFVLAVAILVVLGTAAFIPNLRKDTSNEAFMPKDHPAVVTRDLVKETFGLSDPMVIAVIQPGPRGVFNPHTLSLVHWLTERVMEIPGVNSERVTSLATEKNITGTSDSLIVEPFFEEPPRTQPEADRVREAVMHIELYQGRLISRDGTATLIVAELTDPQAAQDVYESLLRIAGEAPVDGEEIHVAGEGAANGYVGTYIDNDSRRLTPFTVLIISLVLLLAYRTPRGVFLPLVAVLGTLTTALGIMAARGVPYYLITSTMPVILVSISVCDGIHILGHYYQEVSIRPRASQRELVTRTMAAMWRPVTVTSLTTIAGFLALGFTTFMPPVRAFGIFASVGLVAALIFSLGAIPALLVLLSRRGSRALQEGGRRARAGAFREPVVALGRQVLGHPRWVVGLSVLLLAISLIGAVRVRVEDERIRYFRPNEPIFKADRAINRTLDGTNYLDVMIEARGEGDLYDPVHLRKIQALQLFLDDLPRVQSSTSIVDYVKLINRAMNGDDPEASVVPDSQALVAQYFLLYSSSADPSDFDALVDPMFRNANVRAVMNRGRWTDFEKVVRATDDYVLREFDGDELTARVDGRASLGFQWAEELRSSHPRGVALSLLLVWLVTAFCFRSVIAGTLAVVPVVLSIVLIYATMGFEGIWLSAGTSLTSSIAIGLAIDFSIHTLSRLVRLMRDERVSLEEAISSMFESTGRALFFNFIAILLGFGVLMLGSVPSLTRFGLLVGACVSASFLASVTLLPALVQLLRPAFLTNPRRGFTSIRRPGDRVAAPAVGAGTASLQREPGASPAIDRELVEGPK